MIKDIALAGAGTMGTSMALIFAEKGYHVTVVYRHEATGIKSKEQIYTALETKIAEGQLDQKDKDAILKKLTYTKDLGSFAACDLVVESIAEDLTIKSVYWKQISDLAREDAILATNTSGLSITKLATAVSHPERFVGMHWFNPPHLIPLIEVIKGEKTSEATAKQVYDLSLSLGKKPIMVHKDAKGFIANRLQLAVLREAIHIVENGIGSFKDVDDCMKYGLGFRYACLGPFEVTDLGGLDVFHNVAKYLYADLSADQQPQPLFNKLVAESKLGVKSQEGFYDYHKGKDKEAIKNRDAKFMAQSKLLASFEKGND